MSDNPEMKDVTVDMSGVVEVMKMIPKEERALAFEKTLYSMVCVTANESDIPPHEVCVILVYMVMRHIYCTVKDGFELDALADAIKALTEAGKPGGVIHDLAEGRRIAAGRPAPTIN
jgi:hypothetical protein